MARTDERVAARPRRRGAVVIAAALLVAGDGAAQAAQAGPYRFEGRVDVIRNASGDPATGGAVATTAVQAGLGGSAPLSRYVRVSVIGAAGVTDTPADVRRSARVDALARFVLDPEFADRWGAYAGGGLSARYERGADWRGYLLLSLGVEGPRLGRVAPFLELGYGGGTRVGFGVRGAAGRRR